LKIFTSSTDKMDAINEWVSVSIDILPILPGDKA
jgi:hypothetical protein